MCIRRYGIEFRLGERVESIDRSRKTITLRGGEELAYGKLAICTGTRVQTVTLPGSTLAGVHYLRISRTSIASRRTYGRGPLGYCGRWLYRSRDGCGAEQTRMHVTVLRWRQGYDQVVVRGDRSVGRIFSAFYLKWKSWLPQIV